MDVSPPDPSPVAMDLSRSHPLTRSRSDAVDLAKKPEWYHRRPAGCGADMAAPFRSRASPPFGHRRDPEPLGAYMDPGLDLYGDGVRANLWHPGFYGPDQAGAAGAESSGGEESDSGSDVIFLVSSAKEPLLCGPFLPDGVRRIVEPLSPAGSSLGDAHGCYRLPQPLSSPSPDSSFSDDSSDSSADIPVRHARPVVLLSDLSAVYPVGSPLAVSSDDSDVVEVSVTNREQAPPPGKAPPGEVRRSSRIRKSPEAPQSSCSPSRHSLRRRAKNAAVGVYNESGDSEGVIEYAVRLSSSESDRPATPTSPPPPPRVSRTPEEPVQDRKSPQPRQVKSIDAKRKKPPVGGGAKKFRTDGVKSNKTAARRRRKRRPAPGPPAQFPGGEPELKLKYATVKKEKKSGSFCPFVRVETRSCTVVNDQEEAASLRRGGASAAAGRSLPGFVPNTSCFQLGRFSSAAALLCCLCGHSANAVGLGDLHGPYVDAHEISPSPPEPAPPLRECWIHEDCGIWSAGVFLVRGKLYGLQEAARLAQEAVCSACQRTGAIMGCFQKGCARNYHYRCATQSGCVLNEDNFSIRCPEHKNKPLTCVTRQHKR